MGAGLPRRPGGRLIQEQLIEALTAIAEHGILLVASDYDGTLSPIVDDPARAVPHPRAVAAFHSLSEHPRTRCLVVSGRSIEALRGFIGEHPAIELVGNHGADTPEEGSEIGGVDAVSVALEEISSDIDGVLVERKPTGAALHYRHALRPEEAAARARAVADLFGARTIEGKMVVEISLGRGDKGTALDSHRSRTGADHVIFLGDDVTDEAAFESLRDTDIGVKVGPGDTSARYRVGDPDGVADVLEELDRFLRATDR